MNSTDTGTGTDTRTGTRDGANGPTPTSNPARPSDWRPLIVAVVGIVAVLAVAMTAFILLSGSIDSTSSQSQSQSMVAVASASFTAIGAVTSAYFGIRAANRAREDTQDSRDADVVRAASLAAAQPDAIPEAMRAATIEMGRMKAGRLQ
jgi:hypothetical protein